MNRFINRLIGITLSVSMIITLLPSEALKVQAAEIVSNTSASKITLTSDSLELVVNKKTAGYTLKTVEGDILTKSDNNKQLLYNIGLDGDSSFATIRVDGKNYVYGNLQNKGKFLVEPQVAEEGDSIFSVWTEGDVKVKQTLRIIDDPSDVHDGTVKITYDVTNLKSSAASIGTRIVLDTQLGSQDYGIYEMADNTGNGSYIQYTRAKAFNKSEIAAHFRAIDNNTAPRIVAYGYPDTESGKPDKMVFSHWYDMAENLWDFQLPSSSFVTNEDPNYRTADSAAAVYFNEKSIASGEALSSSFYYGIMTNADVKDGDSMKITVNQDRKVLTLADDGVSYKDPYINIQAYLANNLPNSEDVPLLGLKLLVDSDYMELVSVTSTGTGDSTDSETASHSQGKALIRATNVEKGQTRVVNWKLRVKKVPENTRYLKYEVRAYKLDNSSYDPTYGTVLLDSNIIKSERQSVLAAGLSGDKPSVGIIGSSPSALYYKGNRTFTVRGTGFSILSDKSQWEMILENKTTGEKTRLEGSQISFGSECMYISFTKDMPEGEYKLYIKPGSDLTNEQVGLPEEISSENMEFIMSSDEDLINPPINTVFVVKNYSGENPYYEINTELSADTSYGEQEDGSEVLLKLTGNLYETNEGDGSTGVLIGSGDSVPILINEIVKFSGENISIGYSYDGVTKSGVVISMDGHCGVVGGSNSIWNNDVQIELENGTEYSLEPEKVYPDDDDGDPEAEPVKMQLMGIAGAVEKISGFLFELKYGTFLLRESGEEGELLPTISFGGGLSVGFMNPGGYDEEGNEEEMSAEDLFSAHIEDVRYGQHYNKDGDLKNGYIGLKADTDISVPQFLEYLPADMSGGLQIDTIDHNYLVNVHGSGTVMTVEGEFEIEIIGSKRHGVPVPNVISFSVGGFDPGLPIVTPATPIVFLKGASGSVDGLYSLFYPSESDGFPDAALNLSGDLSIEEIFEGTATLGIGTRYAELSAEDMEVFGMDVLNSVDGKFVWYPEVSFSFAAELSVLQIINGNFDAYLLMYGEGAPDLDISGSVDVTLPGVLLGQDLTLTGVSVGGNKEKLYGSVIVLGLDVAFEYQWGAEDLDVDEMGSEILTGEEELSDSAPEMRTVLSATVNDGVAEEQEFIVKNVEYLTSYAGSVKEMATRDVAAGAAVAGAGAAIEAEGGLILDDGSFAATNVESGSYMLRLYYDSTDVERTTALGTEKPGSSEITSSDVTVKLNDNKYDLSPLVMKNGVAKNMDTANITFGEDKFGTYMVISIPKDELTDAKNKITAAFKDSSNMAFSYFEIMSIKEADSKIKSAVASVEDGKILVKSEFENVNKADVDSIMAYISENPEVDAKQYSVLTVDSEGNTYGFKDGQTKPTVKDNDFSRLLLTAPSTIPTGEYYVTVVYKTSRDGNEFYLQKTTENKISIDNSNAPAWKVETVSAESIGNGKVKITAGINEPGDLFTESPSEDNTGIYLEILKKNDAGEFTAERSNFIELSEMTKDAGTNSLSTIINSLVSENGDDYKYIVRPSNRLTDIESTNVASDFTNARYAMGKAVSSEELHVNYPKSVALSIEYGSNYTAEQMNLYSDSAKEGENNTSDGNYTRKTFTDVSTDGIRVDVTSDEPITGTILLDDVKVATNTALENEFPSVYINPGEGEHLLTVIAKNGSGDITRYDESICIDTMAPMLMLSSPVDGTISGNQIPLKGYTDSDATLCVTVNGKAVELSEGTVKAGVIEGSIDIAAGSEALMYEIKLLATDSYGRNTEKSAVVYNDKAGEIDSVYLAFNGSQIMDDTISLKNIDEGKLSLVAMCDGAALEIPDSLVKYDTILSGDEDGGINVSDTGLVTVGTDVSTGVAVEAKYALTDDFAYSAYVYLTDNRQGGQSPTDEGEDEPVERIIYSKDSYSVNIGEKIMVVAGGIKTSGSVKVNSENPEIVSIDNSSVVINREEGTVSFLAEGHTFGSTKITIEAEADENHKALKASVNVNCYYPVTTEHPYYIDAENTVIGSNGWYLDSVHIVAKDGYTLSLTPDDEKSFKPKLIYFAEANKQLVEVYFKDSDNNITIDYIGLKIDRQAPTASISTEDDILSTVLSIVTFGMLGSRESLVKAVDVNDLASGVKDVLYLKSDTIISRDELEKIQDSQFSSSEVKISKHEPEYVYVKLTDNAGNTDYISNDGVLDSATSPLFGYEIPMENDYGWVTTPGGMVSIKAAEADTVFDSIKYSVDGSSYIEGSDNFELKDFDEGEHLVVIRSADTSGNKSTDLVTYRQDTIAPTISLTQNNKKTIDILTKTGASGVASMLVYFNGNKLEDIKSTYKNGYYAKEYGTYQLNMKTGAGITVGASIDMPGDPAVYGDLRVATQKSKNYAIVGDRVLLKIEGVDADETLFIKETKNASIDGRMVTCLKKGTVTVMHMVGKSKKEVCKITVENPKINKTKLKLKPSKTFRFKMLSTKLLSEVKWQTSDPAIATVDETGKFIAVSPGTCKITASIGSHQYECDATVLGTPTANGDLREVTTPDRNYVIEGDRVLLNLETIGADDTLYIKETTNASIDGRIVSCYNKGTVTVMRKSGNTKKKVCTIKVEYPKLNKVKLRISQGKSYKLKLQNTKQVTEAAWQTSNPAIARVDASGNIVAVAAGECTIMATIGNHKYECLVNVY